jgi:hypothetical protein
MTKNYCTNFEHNIFVQKQYIERSADNSNGYRCLNINLTTHNYLVLRRGSVDRNFNY